jgi:hypothetical protein
MPARWKTVRVFISSTFRDMQAERIAAKRLRRPRRDSGMSQHLPDSGRVAADTSAATYG